MKSTISTAAVVIGVVLLVGSVLWGLLFPASGGWTQEKGERLAELTSQSHNLMFHVNAAKEKPSMHGGKSPTEAQAEYDKVKKELEELRVEFEGKRDAPKTAASILRWSGAAFVVGGALVVFASRGS